MKRVLKKIVFTSTNNQWIKVENDVVIGYENKYLMKLMDWLRVQSSHITPEDLMCIQEEMQATYNVKDLIEIPFDQIKTGQEFAITENLPFSDFQLADMGVTKILVTQEYTHAYFMWKSITADNCTWVRFNSQFQEA